MDEAGDRLRARFLGSSALEFLRHFNLCRALLEGFPLWGNSGELDVDRPQGTYQNDIQVLECTPEDPEWSRPDTVGVMPTPRADSEIVYYNDTGKVRL